MILRAPETSPLAKAQGLMAAQRFREAYQVLTEEGARDGECLYMLAMWRLAGQIIRRDLGASRELLRQAAERGQQDAARAYLNFVANGTGGDADWQLAVKLLESRAGSDETARDDLALIESMDLKADGNPIELPKLEMISDRPHAAIARCLFTKDECAFLINQATPRLAPALIIDPRTGQQVSNPIRTSDSMAFPFVQERPAIHALNKRLAALTGTSVEQGEPLQILRYRPGQQYRPHLDAETGAVNQRILTVLVYLNEAYDGGETLFVHNGVRFKGGLGDALVFRNALTDGRPDELSQHAGLPVLSGEKIIASRWIRQRPFMLPPPAPLLPF